MAISGGSYSTAPPTRQAGGIRIYKLLVILLLVAPLVIAGYILFRPQAEIELEPPLSNTIDPIIRARKEAAQQSDMHSLAKPEAEPGGQTASTTISTTEAANTSDTSMTSKVETAQIAVPAQPVAPPPVEVPRWIRDQQQTRDGEIARAMIQSIRRGGGPFSIEQIHERAQQLDLAGRQTDAYLLYFYAARQGHGPSAFALGTLNDPDHFSSGNELLEKPDPMQAHKWYSIAAASRVDGAQERLQKLHESTQAAALAGDTTAQRLLMNWE